MWLQNRAQIRAQRKLEHDGGTQVKPGPARRPMANPAKGGKPRDKLVDDIVLEFEVQVQVSATSKIPKTALKKKDGKIFKTVVYCVGCDKYSVGRTPARIKKHAKDCHVSVPDI